MFLAAVYLLSLGSRLPALLFPPRGFLYNTDEIYMALTPLDRFIGLPVCNLAWPPTILSLISLPAFLADFFFRSHFTATLGADLNVFAVYLSHAYADPRHSILIMRWVVALVSSAAPLLAYYIGARLGRSPWIGLACALLVSFQPTFYQQSVTAAGDSPGVTLALAGLLCLLPEVSLRSATAAGFLFSAALAAKITVADLLVLPVLLILLDGSLRPLGKRAAALLRFCGGLIAGFMLCCPYVWTDPLRLGKMALGNVIKPGSAADLHVFLGLWNEAMGSALTLLMILALGCGAGLMIMRQQARVVLASFAALLVVLTPLFLHSTIAFPRYFLPALPCLVVLIAAGFRIFSLEHPLLRRWRAPALAFLLAAGLTVCAQTSAQEWGLRGPDELTAAVKVIQTLPETTTLYLPEEALRTFEVPLSQRACQHMVATARSHLEDESAVMSFAKMRGIPSLAADVLLWSLNGDDQAEYRRVAAACAAQPPGSRDVFIYYPPYEPRRLDATRTSLATMNLDTAIQEMQRADNAAILLPLAAADLGKPVWGGETWHWYRH